MHRQDFVKATDTTDRPCPQTPRLLAKHSYLLLVIDLAIHGVGGGIGGKFAGRLAQGPAGTNDGGRGAAGMVRKAKTAAEEFNVEVAAATAAASSKRNRSSRLWRRRLCLEIYTSLDL